MPFFDPRTQATFSFPFPQAAFVGSPSHALNHAPIGDYPVPVVHSGVVDFSAIHVGTGTDAVPAFAAAAPTEATSHQKAQVPEPVVEEVHTHDKDGLFSTLLEAVEFQSRGEASDLGDSTTDVTTSEHASPAHVDSAQPTSVVDSQGQPSLEQEVDALRQENAQLRAALSRAMAEIAHLSNKRPREEDEQPTSKRAPSA
jgi:hypothetical protein